MDALRTLQAYTIASTEFWEWLGLLAVIGIILYQRVPAFIAAALDARAMAISKELDQARHLREEAETLLVDYRQKAEHAQAEAETILVQTRAEAERFKAEAQEQLKAQLERRARQAKERIAQAEANAIAEIRAIAADTAATAAGKIIAARLDATKGDALISGSIGELSTKLN
jgi:F-type H+-transporting ATPase subunit b